MARCESMPGAKKGKGFTTERAKKNPGARMLMEGARRYVRSRGEQNTSGMGVGKALK